MESKYLPIQNDEVLETECQRFVKQFMTFFQDKTAVKTCNLAFLQQAILQFDSLSTSRLDLTTTIKGLINTINSLIPKIHDQQTFDQIGTALFLTKEYVDSKIQTKEDLQLRLQSECGIVLQKHHKYTIAGYTLSAAIVLGTLALGVALPYVALALVVAGSISAITYQHTHDPRRIIGDKLFHAGFEPSAPKAKNQPDDLSAIYGI